MRDRQAVQRSDRVPVREPFVRQECLLAGPFRVQRDDRVDLRVHAFDAVQVNVEQLARGDLAVADEGGEPGRRQVAELVAHGPQSFGTRGEDASASGR